jgi:hypothetical protein
MSGDTRKLHYKHIRDFADQHIGHKGDIWYDPASTILRFYNGTAGGTAVGGYSSSDLIDYGSNYAGELVIAIDLTKKYHWLVDLTSGGKYTLANGTEGQEITFFACSGLMGAGQENSDIWVDTVKHYVDAGPSSQWTTGSMIIRAFSHSVVSNAQGMVKAQFIRGCWHFGSPVEVIDSF